MLARDAETPRSRLLVNYWYAHPVGHAIEALRYCLGYHKADPSLRVSVLLNDATPAVLADCCPFIDAVYPVSYRSFVEPDGNPRDALAAVPRHWDWIVENHRAHDPRHDRYRGFRGFYDSSREYFETPHGTGTAGTAPPAYEPHHQLKLDLPSEARSAAAATLLNRRAISVVLAGHSDSRAFYPSTASWALILSRLAARFPDAVFCLIGKLAASAAWSTSRITRPEVERIAAACPTIDCFDRPLLEQLAIVEESALYVSPHTGFGFAAVSVGTPWLAISGGQWHESFFNGVPFCSVLPDTDRFPCFAWGQPLPLIETDVDGEGARTVSMSAARIREDLPEILDGASRLIERRLTYEEALADYFPRLLAAYHHDRSRIFSFDGIHERYL